MSNVLSDIFSNRKQRVVLHGQTSFYAKIDAGVAQEFILGLFLLLIYINDLSDSLSSNVKLFADETSLFPVKHDINAPVSELSNCLKKINDQAFHLKVSFNPDRSKQAQEIIFSRKLKKTTHPCLVFSNSNISQINSQKYLRVNLLNKIKKV